MAVAAMGFAIEFGNSNCRFNWTTNAGSRSNRLAWSRQATGYPSKWNTVEHHLFSEISKTWAGCPLRTFTLIAQLISDTTIQSGLIVYAHLLRLAIRLVSRVPTTKWICYRFESIRFVCNGTIPFRFVTTPPELDARLNLYFYGF